MSDRVPMKHPKTGGEIDVPETAVKIHERAGWVRTDKPEPAETPAAPETPASAPRGGKTAGKEEAK